jgi:hypothetical protein
LKDLVVLAVDLFQKIAVYPRHEKRSREIRAVDLGDETIGFFKIVAGSKILHSKESSHPGGRVGLTKVIFRDPKCATLLLRKVDPTKFLQIVRDIPKDVCQLESKTESHGIVGSGTGLAVKDIDGDKAHGGSDPVTVFTKILKGFVPILRQVHFDTCEDIEEGFGGNEVATHDGG